MNIIDGLDVTTLDEFYILCRTSRLTFPRPDAVLITSKLYKKYKNKAKADGFPVRCNKYKYFMCLKVLVEEPHPTWWGKVKDIFGIY